MKSGSITEKEPAPILWRVYRRAATKEASL